MGNQIKTVLFLGALTGLLLVIGKMLAGSQGMVVALMFAILMNAGAYWFSDRIVLAMYGAKQVHKDELPVVYDIVEKLCLRAGLPMPRIYLIPSDSPNAFATGRNPKHAAVALTHGILRLLNREELEGVIAHELSHIRNRDILVATIAATIAGAIMIIADMARFAAIFGIGRRDDEEGGGLLELLFLAIVAPIAALLIQLAISRSREFLADSTGARISGNPYGLASALEKLEYAASRIPMSSNPATAHMFIVNPLSAETFMKLFSTHPPIRERIERLKRMSPSYW